jgi:hypothetical protein
MVFLPYVSTGNLPLGACCYICEEDCGSECGLVDWLCCWCQRTVHSQCLTHIGEVFILWRICLLRCGFLTKGFIYIAVYNYLQLVSVDTPFTAATGSTHLLASTITVQSCIHYLPAVPKTPLTCTVIKILAPSLHYHTVLQYTTTT